MELRLAGWRTPERVSHQIGTGRHVLTAMSATNRS